MAHLIDDKTVAKMGHPTVVVDAPFSHISTIIHTNLHHSCTLPFTPIAPTLKRCPITDR
jgi:hypothetical protein